MRNGGVGNFFFFKKNKMEKWKKVNVSTRVACQKLAMKGVFSPVASLFNIMRPIRKIDSTSELVTFRHPNHFWHQERHSHCDPSFLEDLLLGWFAIVFWVFVVESGAKWCGVIVSGKLCIQHAKLMKVKGGYLISSSQSIENYNDSTQRHVLLR